MRACVGLTNVKVNPAELNLPADFKITSAGDCTTSFFGFAHDRKLIVEEVTKPDPATTYTRWFSYPLDRNGQLQIPVYYLDYLTYVLLIGYVLLMEWRFGATLGKYFLKLRVGSIIAPDGKLTFGQAVKRLLIYVWLVPIGTLVLIGWILGLSPETFLTLTIWSFVISGLLGFSIAVNIIYSIWHGQRPWHDRWANTVVISGRDQSIAPTLVRYSPRGFLT